MKIRNFIIFAMFGLLLGSCSQNLSNLNRPTTRSFEFNYELTIGDSVDSSGGIEIWLPIPSSDNIQSIEILNDSSNLDFEIISDSQYRNRFACFRFSPDELENNSISISYKIKRMEIRALSSTVEIDSSMLTRFLAPDKLVPIDGEIATEASEVAVGKETDLDKAHALYEHLFSTIEYDKSGDGWGRGDALYACDIRKGNCTDFHSAFIGMARSLGIPSKFEIGFSIPEDKTEGSIGGYHCWAQFWLDDIGWVPVDISEAYKHPENKDYLFGNLDPNRVTFSVGRDIIIPGVDKSFNYMIYPYMQVDGIASDNFTTSFSFSQ